MKKLPKHVKGVSGKKIPVDVVDRDTVDGAAGMFYFTPPSIEIAEDLPKADKEETLVHELLHYCFQESKVRPALRRKAMSLVTKGMPKNGIHDWCEALEEMIVERLDGPLTEILKRNKLFP